MTQLILPSFQCNEKTYPIRESQKYNELKRAAIKREISAINFEQERARILPAKENTIKERSALKEKILEDVKEFNQREFDEMVEKKLGQSTKNSELSLTEIKQRGRHIREILNKCSGI